MAERVAGITLLGTALKQRDQESRLERAKRDLFWLCTEILGFTLLTEKFHKPMLDKQDAMRRLRMSGARGAKDTLWLWQRGAYKTTCRKGQVIQDLLWDPFDTMIWWHAVEERAWEACEEISSLIQHCKELRKIIPYGEGRMPSPSAKRFIGKKGFRLPCQPTSSPETFRAFGSGGEATGGHAKRCYLDDPVGDQDVVNSQMPAKITWYRRTVCSVINSDGWKDATGTRWDAFDFYEPLIKSPYWSVTVRGDLETNGVPDYQGEPTTRTREQVEKDRHEMGESAFAYQRMNDATFAGERPWDAAKCEHDPLTLAEAQKGDGVIVVITDPAPAKMGSIFTPTNKAEDENPEKNEWATVAIRFRVNGQRREIVLLDGEASRNWGVDEGFERAILMAKKWKTPHIAPEKTGQAVAFYEKSVTQAARKLGAACHVLDMEQTYSGKNMLFGALCDRAKIGEFLVADSCPPEFLFGEEGDSDNPHPLSFFFQARSWRVVGKKNSLRLDDRANVVSMACDSAFGRIAPYPEVAPEELQNRMAFFRRPENMPPQRTRYLGF